MRKWLLLLLLIPTASAHDDRAVVDDAFTLAPGQAIDWTRAVHWHRLMGTIESTQPVQLTVAGPEGTQEVASGTSLRLSHLITCCETVWTDHTITLTNEGDAAADVHVDLALLHDNLAVLAHDAEPGGWWQTLAIVGLIIAVPAWRARQAPPQAREADRWLRRSRIAHATTWGLALLLAVVGMARFRTGPMTGTLGATQPMPWGVAGFLNTHSLVMLGLMAGWGAAAAFWAGARRRAGSPQAFPVDGAWLAAGSLLTGIALASETGALAIPLALGALPAAAIVLDMRWPPSPVPPHPRGPRL